MKVPGVVEGERIRPLYPVPHPSGTEVEIVLPEVEISGEELRRRREWWDAHRKLQPIDIRPLTTTDLVRESRDGL